MRPRYTQLMAESLLPQSFRFPKPVITAVSILQNSRIDLRCISKKQEKKLFWQGGISIWLFCFFLFLRAHERSESWEQIAERIVIKITCLRVARSQCVRERESTHTGGYLHLVASFALYICINGSVASGVGCTLNLSSRAHCTFAPLSLPKSPCARGFCTSLSLSFARAWCSQILFNIVWL